MNRLRELVEQHATYTPEASKASLQQMMPEFRRVTLATVARLQIMAQIKGGQMRYQVDEPEESSD
jgi:hypothetical protein